MQCFEIHHIINTDKDSSEMEEFMIYLSKPVTGLLVAHFENIGFYTGSSSSKYRLFTGFSIKNIG